MTRVLRLIVTTLTLICFSSMTTVFAAEDGLLNKKAVRLALLKMKSMTRSKDSLLKVLNARYPSGSASRHWATAELNKVKRWPETTLTNDALLIRDEKGTLTVRMTDFSALAFEVNGREFKLDPSLTLKGQAEVLQKLLNGKKSASRGLELNLFSTAQADGGATIALTAAAVVFIAGAIGALWVYSQCAFDQRQKTHAEALKGTIFDGAGNPLLAKGNMTLDECVRDYIAVGEFAERVSAFNCDRERGVLTIPVQNVKVGDIGTYVINFDPQSGSIRSFKRDFTGGPVGSQTGTKQFTVENGKVTKGWDQTKPGTTERQKQPWYLPDDEIVDQGEAMLPHIKVWAETCRDQLKESDFYERLRKGNRPSILDPGDKTGTKEEGSK